MSRKIWYAKNIGRIKYQDPTSVSTFQEILISSFFGGTNWQAWLLQLMPEINKKTYWYPETVDIISRFDNYLETLDNNVKNATPQRILLKDVWYG